MNAPAELSCDIWGTAPPPSSILDSPSSQLPLSSFDPLSHCQPPIEVLDYDAMMAEILRLEAKARELTRDVALRSRFQPSLFS